LTDDAPVGLMSLEYEYRMMRLMQGTVGFPRLYGGSFDSSPQHYVMELLGMDMKGLMLSYPDHVVPRSDLVGLAHQMVDRLEAMHERGFVMYDIHLKNFLIHNEVVYVIDLAIAHPMSSSNPVRDICTQPFFGTVTNTAYASDDMLRLMYLLVAMAEGYLPWVGLGDGEKAAVKRNSRAYNVCLGRAAWLVGAFEYVESLTPGSRVDYDRLKRLLA
jgi:tRNA A-37 threonylcarbamoyl transferase component Bud32